MQIVTKEFIDKLTPNANSKMRKEAVAIVDRLTKMSPQQNLFIGRAEWKDKVKYKTNFRAWFANLEKRIENGKHPNPLIERLLEGWEYRVASYEEGWIINKLKE